MGSSTEVFLESMAYCNIVDRIQCTPPAGGVLVSRRPTAREDRMNSEATARVADVVAREVRAAGAEWAFGHPGGEVVTLIDALRKVGIKFVLTRHEASAAFAAGGYAELTGRPGVCI